MSSSSQQRRRAEFREVARAIIRKDREWRKLGLTVDTGGAIARALEQAYQRGRKEALSGSVKVATAAAPDAPIEWIEIPPRPRKAFWHFYLWALGACDNRQERRTSFVRESRRWWLMSEGLSRDKSSFYGERTVRPLVRLGLLQEKERGTVLVMTDKGRKTWETAVAKDPMIVP